LGSLNQRIDQPPGWDAFFEGLEDLGMSFSRQYGQYQLRLPSDAWVDIEAGNSALDWAEAAVRNGEARNDLGSAAVAASIARRPFLTGVEGFGVRVCKASWTVSWSEPWIAWARFN